MKHFENDYNVKASRIERVADKHKRDNFKVKLSGTDKGGKVQTLNKVEKREFNQILRGL
jgi:hypothetical protein